MLKEPFRWHFQASFKMIKYARSYNRKLESVCAKVARQILNILQNLLQSTMLFTWLFYYIFVVTLKHESFGEVPSEYKRKLKDLDFPEKHQKESLADYDNGIRDDNHKRENGKKFLDGDRVKKGKCFMY